MIPRLRVGISTCPNDTFAFHGLLTGEVRAPGLELDFELLDIEELNTGLESGRFDLAKVSTHAALALSSEVLALPVGWALGHGVGPVVLAARERSPETPVLDPAHGAPARAAPPRVLAPGARTTATLLWRLFHPEAVRLEQRVFSEIVPALERGEADLGVCIHEARFTWRERRLALVEDLGTTWERATGCPLPLGGLAARRSLAPELLRAVCTAFRTSLERAWAAPEATLPTLRRYAQEEADAVLWKHVELYVNARTRELGTEGRQAFEALARLARERGLAPSGGSEGPALEVFDG